MQCHFMLKDGSSGAQERLTSKPYTEEAQCKHIYWLNSRQYRSKATTTASDFCFHRIETLFYTQTSVSAVTCATRLFTHVTQPHDRC